MTVGSLADVESFRSLWSCLGPMVVPTAACTTVAVVLMIRFRLLVPPTLQFRTWLVTSSVAFLVIGARLICANYPACGDALALESMTSNVWFRFAPVPAIVLLTLASFWFGLRRSPYLRDPQSGMLLMVLASLGITPVQFIAFPEFMAENTWLAATGCLTLGILSVLPLGYAMGALREAKDHGSSNWVHRAGVLIGYAMAVAMPAFYNFHCVRKQDDWQLPLSIWFGGILLGWLLWIASSRLHPRVQITANISKACSACGNLSAATAVSCESCNAPMAVLGTAKLVCGGCHSAIDGNWRFCTSCGARLRRG